MPNPEVLGTRAADNTPFFILGCVRSGTTLLRDLLRLHPRLECPEETHFYRWADPFGSPRYDKNYITMKIFERHRQMDGISNQAFHDDRYRADNRREMSEAYGSQYLAAVGNPEGRWFDKTPQNIYGVFLLAHQFSESKLVHIHRHPVNVVASLVEGRVMAKHSVKGAVNYWMEAMILVSEFKKLYPERLFDIRYEALCLHPYETLEKLCHFLKEDLSAVDRSHLQTHPEQNKYQKVLTEDEVNYVMNACREFLATYGYTELPGRGSHRE